MKFILVLLLLASGCSLRAAAPESRAASAGKNLPVDPVLSATASFTLNSIYQTDAVFTDDGGHSFVLGELRGRPVVLAMFFASCGFACPRIVADMQALRTKLSGDAGREAVFVLVSFDTVRDTPAALAKYRHQRALDGHWVLLNGDDNSVRELAALLGVKYRKESDGAFSHSNLITILNREGEVVYQRPGLTGGLDEAAAALTALIPTH